MDLHLREAQHSDLPFLEDMLYEAVFWRSGTDKPSRKEGLAYPGVAKSLADWGRRVGDTAVVATVASTPAGAAWFRFWADDDYIRGYVEAGTPVLVIAVHSAYRRRGIAGAMIEWLAERAAVQGIQRISLAVSKDSSALTLYRQRGFVEHEDIGDSLLMVRDLDGTRHGDAAPIEMTVRPSRESDRSAVIRITSELVRAGDTYAFDPDTTDEALWSYWSPQPPARGYVVEVAGEVVGAFIIRPNHPGPGSHIANASYVVRADMRGRGIGRRLGEASLGIAAELGFRAMQFNIVIGSNEPAIALWHSLGFRIVGTIPAGFRLPDGRYVPYHVMYRELP